MSNTKSYPALIKEARRRKNLSQLELAKLSGVSQATISKYENGMRKRFDHENLLAIARVLRIRVAVIKTFR